jgi:pimeloyl-ACP methyl ester carboxylesterase
MNNVRFYGERPYTVAVVHGGPGAPGEMAPVARELANAAGVLEPLQTKNTLEGQVVELHDVVERYGESPINLVGFSWGAWLSFIVTARYPEIVRKLVLIGSGPFEERYADNIVPDRLNRLTEAERIEAFDLIESISAPDAEDRDKPMARLGELFAKADAYDPLPYTSEALGFSEEINRRVWAEANELRVSGEILELGKKIKCPVVAIHGDYDPHLAEGVREPLTRILENFKFILLEKCGHEPWLEKFARDEFYSVLKNELE